MTLTYFISLIKCLLNCKRYTESLSQQVINIKSKKQFCFVQNNTNIDRVDISLTTSKHIWIQEVF